ncbi:hypothetical protein BKA60DRAFT_557278 [Fusarium oxysporum]|nr:hypothetical protein BKA60DRAFT_557278 [Fusarium oxysporum]
MNVRISKAKTILVLMISTGLYSFRSRVSRQARRHFCNLGKISNRDLIAHEYSQAEIHAPIKHRPRHLAKRVRSRL